jgi:hypothetical protein
MSCGTGTLKLGRILASADLSATDLTHANLSGATLVGAKLTRDTEGKGGLAKPGGLFTVEARRGRDTITESARGIRRPLVLRADASSEGEETFSRA